MLEALAGREFIDTAAVVTRYFGGTLLGAGGLARAYSDAVQFTIDLAAAGGQVVQRERRDLFRLSLPHADAGRVEAELRQRGVTILGTDYGRTAVLRMTADGGADLSSLVSGITSGTAVVEPTGSEWIDVEPT
jgi:putative IMPACT (imprinted ancient) family translation regulator